MITIIHGKDLSSSRAALTTKKAGFPPEAITTIDEENLEEIAQAGGAKGMFNPKRLVVLEKRGRWTKKFSRELMEQLKFIDRENHIIIWYEKKIPKSDTLLQLTKKRGEVLYFKGYNNSKDIFDFLDSLGNRNKKAAYIQLQQLQENGEHPIYILNRIIGLFRKMMAVKWNAKKLIPSHPYAKKKITSQTSNFTEKELLGIYKELEKADIGMKTGTDAELLLHLLIEKICKRG